MGLIIQNDEGEVQVTACNNLRSNYLPVVAEAEALRYALFTANDLGMHQVIFVGDCLQVVNEVNSFQSTPTIQSPVIYDIQKLLSQNSLWSVKFINREANVAAHVLAKVALSCNSQLVWMEDCPNDVISIVLKDKECN